MTQINRLHDISSDISQAQFQLKREEEMWQVVSFDFVPFDLAVDPHQHPHYRSDCRLCDPATVTQIRLSECMLIQNRFSELGPVSHPADIPGIKRWLICLITHHFTGGFVLLSHHLILDDRLLWAILSQFTKLLEAEGSRRIVFASDTNARLVRPEP